MDILDGVAENLEISKPDNVIYLSLTQREYLIIMKHVDSGKSITHRVNVQIGLEHLKSNNYNSE